MTAIWLSIVYSGIAKELAALAVRHYGQAPITRVIPALFLIALGFFGG